jgi:hypothetical protein
MFINTLLYDSFMKFHYIAITFNLVHGLLTMYSRNLQQYVDPPARHDQLEMSKLPIIYIFLCNI